MKVCTTYLKVGWALLEAPGFFNVPTKNNNNHIIENNLMFNRLNVQIFYQAQKYLLFQIKATTTFYLPRDPRTKRIHQWINGKSMV